MLVTGEVFEKREAGDSILTGFGSSSGSSTDEAAEQEEYLDEITRQMAEDMFLDDDEKEARENKNKTTMFQPDNQVIKEHGDGSTGPGFVAPKGSGMRVVFLGESGSRNGSAGTGVFIPHATGPLPNHHLRCRRQLRQVSGRCSRVLIPERVLNSLKRHHEKRNAGQAAHSNAMFPVRQNQSFQHRVTPSYKAVLNNHQETPSYKAVLNNHQETPSYKAVVNNYQETPYKAVVNKHQETSNMAVVNNDDEDEFQLPREWTY